MVHSPCGRDGHVSTAAFASTWVSQRKIPSRQSSLLREFPVAPRCLRRQRAPIFHAASPVGDEYTASLNAVVDPALQFLPEKGGLFVQRDLRPGRDLVQIPMSVVLSAASARKSLQGLHSDAVLLNDRVVLAVALLYEQDRGSESPFAPLLSSPFDHPLLWADEAAERSLQGSGALSRLLEIRNQVDSEFEEIEGEVSWSRDAYRRIQAIILSQSVWDVTKPNECLIVPIISQARRIQSASFQFSPGAADVSLTYVGFFREPRLRLLLRGECKSGDEIVLEGSRLSSDFLVEHGHLDPEDPVTMELSFSVSRMDPFFDDKEDILENYAGNQAPPIEEAGFAFSSDTTSVPDDLLNYVRLLCLCPPDAFLLESVFRSDVWAFMQLPVSAENERSALEAIIGACESGLEDREPKPQQVTLPLAERLLNGERNALHGLIKACRRELASLESKEYYQERRLRELDLLRPIEECEVIGDVDASLRARQAFDQYQ